MTSYLNVHFKNASEEHKYDLLLKLVGKNELAKRVVRKYEVSDEDAFNKVLTDLEKRFTVVRSIAFKELSKLMEMQLRVDHLRTESCMIARRPHIPTFKEF